VGQHGGLIAAAGAHLQGLAELAAGPQDLDHPRHDEGLRDGLLQAQRQSRVLVGAGGQCLFDKQVARHRHHGRQHTLVTHALLAQALDHARSGALGGLQGGPQYLAAHLPSQSRTVAIWP
jgi:hypothetical protein